MTPTTITIALPVPLIQLVPDHIKGEGGLLFLLFTFSIHLFPFLKDHFLQLKNFHPF